MLILKLYQAMGKRSEKLVEVYENTLKQIPEILKDQTIGYSQKINLSDIKFQNKKQTKIEIWKSDSISAVIKAHSENTSYKICVLNMASNKRPGGGVKNGAKAQEEDLFRCSTLPLAIPQNLYPLSEGEFIYTNEVYVFKNAQYENITPIKVDVVSMPAVNLNYGKYNKTTDEYDDKIIEKPSNYAKTMLKKIHAILSVAEQNKCDTIILGAWGCGVFKNDPVDVAHFFKSTLDSGNYKNCFKKIIFPIFNDKNSRGDNYAVFNKILSS